jgi:hypothetical protein
MANIHVRHRRCRELSIAAVEPVCGGCYSMLADLFKIRSDSVLGIAARASDSRTIQR